MNEEQQRKQLEEILDDEKLRIEYDANSILYFLLFPIERELMERAKTQGDIPNTMEAPWEFWGEDLYQKAINHIAVRIHTGKFAMNLAWHSALVACFNYNARLSAGKFFMDQTYRATYWDFMQQMSSAALFPHKISESIRKGGENEEIQELYNQARAFLKMAGSNKHKHEMQEAKGIPMNFRIATRAKLPTHTDTYVVYVIQSIKTLRSFLDKFGLRNQIIFTHLEREKNSGLIYNTDPLMFTNFLKMLIEKGAEEVKIGKNATIDEIRALFCYDVFRTTIGYNKLPTQNVKEMERIVAPAFAVNQLNPSIMKLEFKDKKSKRYRMHHIDYRLKAYPSIGEEQGVTISQRQDNVPGLVIEAHVGGAIDHYVGEFHPQHSHALAKTERKTRSLREHGVLPITRKTFTAYFANFVTGPARSMLTDLEQAIASYDVNI